MNKMNSIPNEHLKRLKNISHVLKEMRFVDGRTQDGCYDIGLSRRQVQHCESGNNISLLKLFSVLDAYGYQLKDFVDMMDID